jgi:hypothetical protein
VFLDQPTFSKQFGYFYCSVIKVLGRELGWSSHAQVSRDQKLVAFTVDTTAKEKFDAYVKDISRDEIVRHSNPPPPHCAG